MSEPNNIDKLVAQDPYYLWRELPYGARLPREVVATGLARWLQAHLVWIWDQRTQIKLPWYLARIDGLVAWSLDEAALRLSTFSNQDSFTAAEFHELHFAESLRKKKVAALRDPFWDELILHKKAEGDLNFFTHLPVLIHQPPYEFRQAKRLFCLLWDRGSIPLQYWSYAALAAYLEVTLSTLNRHAIAPDTEALRQWVSRLGLVPFRPAVVTRYDSRERQIPIDGFCLEAFQLARIPAPISNA
jgi:hypothetical protein